MFCYLRSFNRRTNFNPDQILVTAQTFTSTNPPARPISRTIFSSRSLETPELFFGQLIQSIPAGFKTRASAPNCFLNSACELVKNRAKSSEPPGLVSSHWESADRSSVRTSVGAFVRRTRNPGLMPSFFGRGVPEYPGMQLFLSQRCRNAGCRAFIEGRKDLNTEDPALSQRRACSYWTGA
jgi:hypothetical protein